MARRTASCGPIGDGCGKIRRVGDNVVEAAKIGRQRLGQVVNDRSQAAGQAVAELAGPDATTLFGSGPDETSRS